LAAGPDRLGSLDEEQRARLRPQALPDRVEAMKAALTERRDFGQSWLLERKLDGIRCLAIKDAHRVRLASRNQLSLNERFPEIVAALGADAATEFVIDGEIVAFDGARTSFSRLQQRGSANVAVFLYVFDLLHLGGFDTTRLPLRARKALLRRSLSWSGPIRLTVHRNGGGEALFRDACRRGWEGLIAKREDAPYTRGRSSDWLKLKCSVQQELVVGGYTPPRGSRIEFGALLLGYFQDRNLRYAGKVGTGFTRAGLRELAVQLQPLRRQRSPFAEEVRERGAVWVEPELVAEVAFSEWTRDGRLRHPSFLGLRDDKPAAEVVRE
jgi:bifunctional non-homologous end joining protein LigD